MTIYICALCSLCFLVGCSDNGTLLSELEKAPLKIKVASSLTDEIEYYFKAKDKIGITLKDIAENTNPIVNMPVSFDGVEWILQEPFYMVSSYIMAAYYPYDNSISDLERIPIDIYKQSDILTASTNVERTSSKAELNFSHALTCVEFAFQSNMNSGAVTLTGLKVKTSPGKSVFGLSGTLNAFTGEVSFTKEYEAVYSISGFPLVDEINYTSVKCYPVYFFEVSATDESGDMEIEFEFDEHRKYSWQVPLGTVWAKGYKNTYSVSVSPTGLTIQDIGVEKWEIEDSDYIEF